MRIELDEVILDADVRGSGEAVMLLHGWPDSKDLWRYQAPALVHSGYRVIAVDLRGFGASSRPSGVEAYQVPRLVGDVIGVLDRLGVEQAHLVGHDWGAAIAWMTAALAPARVATLTALSVGHPAAFRGAGWAQREKSWYMLLFQFPGVAEQWLCADGFRNLREWSSHPDVDTVVARLSEPGALTASLNVYRANLAPASLVTPAPAAPPVSVRTMGVWSSGDLALTEEQMTGSAAYVDAPWRYERIDGVGHWMPLQAPESVNALLLDFLADGQSGRPDPLPYMR